MAAANLGKSHILAGVIQQRYKHTFRCAYEWVLQMSERALYVEGFAVDLEGVMEHGWVEIDGDIIETTLEWRRKEYVQYFAGMKYKRDRAMRLVQAGQAVPLAWKYDSLGWGNPHYEWAYRNALAYHAAMQE